jgi:hypothetical protein
MKKLLGVLLLAAVLLPGSGGDVGAYINTPMVDGGIGPIEPPDGGGDKHPWGGEGDSDDGGNDKERSNSTLTGYFTVDLFLIYLRSERFEERDWPVERKTESRAIYNRSTQAPERTNRRIRSEKRMK